jgi:hypothetical protein
MVFFLTSSLVLAQRDVDPRDFVYKIRIAGCVHAPVSRSQSGFRVNGTSGIWTALHGVADCNTITAERSADSRGPVLTEALQVRQVDIGNDVALLGSQELSAMPAVGLEPARVVDWSKIRQVAVYGFPYGIDLVRSVLDAREPPLTVLASRLEDIDITTFKNRKSPSVNNEVLDLERGTLLPGESGAPVVDLQSRRVIAIAEGGLKRGFAQISWSIRYDSIRLTDRAAVSRELNQLAAMPANQLFSFAERDLPIPPERQLIKIDGVWQTGTGACSNVVNIGGTTNLNCEK